MNHPRTRRPAGTCSPRARREPETPTTKPAQSLARLEAAEAALEIDQALERIEAAEGLAILRAAKRRVFQRRSGSLTKFC